jgi:hypothetical protein
MSISTANRGERRSFDPHSLWVEALWGAGLIGGVLVSVALIAAFFGR